MWLRGQVPLSSIPGTKKTKQKNPKPPKTNHTPMYLEDTASVVGGSPGSPDGALDASEQNLIFWVTHGLYNTLAWTLSAMVLAQGNKGPGSWAGACVGRVAALRGPEAEEKVAPFRRQQGDQEAWERPVRVSRPADLGAPGQQEAGKNLQAGLLLLAHHNSSLLPPSPEPSSR